MSTGGTIGNDSTAVLEDPLAALRHDLRTPIGHIIGYAEMLIEQSEEEGQEPSSDLERIRVAGQRLLRLVDERLQSGLTLPRLGDDPSASDVPDFFAVGSPEPVAPEEAGLLLVIDDDPENRAVLSQRLERLGHKVVTATSGAEGLAMLSGQGFDLVLLDRLMPDRDGLEVLQQIKADTALTHTPVIMISALDDVESVARCIELGAEDYLPKPFNATLLRARIGASLRATRAHAREMRLNAELRENYERLRQAEMMRDDLTHMIVHDLRTPLTSLMTGLQTFEALGGMSGDQEEMLAISLQGAETLLGMINDLLDISKLEDGSLKLEDGSLKLERAPLNPAQLVERSLGQVTLLARSKGITLAEEIAPDMGEIIGDEDKLRRTLVNLVGNALKFTPTGGTVTVGTRRNDDKDSGEILFWVRDTGEGIPKEAFSRIFEKFGQVESRKAGRKMSTGLGLTFCKMAVEAHGGHIWVESELGHGSTFWFSLPAQPV